MTLIITDNRFLGRGRYMTKIGVVYTTFATTDDAKRILTLLIEGGFAKCGNIGAPHLAIYPWKGKMAEESEVAVLIKTPADRVDKLIDYLRTIHPYELPCIFTWAPDAIPDYADWLNE